jgi:streptogramin lyase
MAIVKMLRSSRRRPISVRQALTIGVVAAGLGAGYFVSGGSVGATAQGRDRGGLQGTVTMTGTVDAAKPFKAAQVYIRNVDKQMLYMVYTNAGKFRAVALLPGNYEIDAQARGLESDVQKLVVKPGERPEVRLSMRDSANPDRFPTSVKTPARDITLASYEEIYPPGPGRQVLEEVCFVCHGENFFSMRPRNEAGWQAAIDLMVGKNLYDRDRISSAEGILAPPATQFRFGAEDRKELLAYLTKHLGEGAKPRAVRSDKEVQLDEAKLAKAQFIEYYLKTDAPKGGAATSAAAGGQPQGELANSNTRIAYTLQLDNQGNAWLVDRGNPNRLVKLDPRTAEQNDYVLPDPRAGVHEILIDREGIIWVPELGGQPRTREYKMLGFNPNTGKWQHQIIADPDNAIRNPSKVGMHGSTVDSRGNLYMNWFMNGAIGRWDRATGKIDIYRIPTPGAIPYGMAIDKNDNIWSALWNGGKIVKFDTTTKQFTEFSPPTYPANVRRGVGVDSKNNVWFGIYAAGPRPGKIAKLDQTTGRITEWTVPHRGSQPYEATADLQDNIWFPDTAPPVNQPTIGKFDPKTQSFTFYPKPQTGSDSPKLQHAADGAVWYTARTATPGATGFGVLYPDMDKINSLGSFPLNGAPGYAFKVQTH